MPAICMLKTNKSFCFCCCCCCCCWRWLLQCGMTACPKHPSPPAHVAKSWVGHIAPPARSNRQARQMGHQQPVTCIHRQASLAAGQLNDKSGTASHASHGCTHPAAPLSCSLSAPRKPAPFGVRCCAQQAIRGRGVHKGHGWVHSQHRLHNERAYSMHKFQLSFCHVLEPPLALLSAVNQTIRLPL